MRQIAGAILLENTIDAHGRRSDNAQTVRTSTLSSSAKDGTDAVNKKNRTSTSDKAKNEEGTSNLEERKRKVIEQVREYVQITFTDLRVASRRETDKLLEGTKHITEEDIDGWERYVNGTMNDQIASARILYNQLTVPLFEALHNKTVSMRVVSKIFADFSSEDIDYKKKEWYVQTIFPERLASWKKIKGERDDLVQEKGIRELDGSGIENFQKLFDVDAFAKLEWKERKKLVEEVFARLAAKKNGTERLLPGIRAQLESYAEEKILHPSKVATWMKRIFVGNKDAKQIDHYMKTVVEPHANRWRIVKQDYIDLHQRMGANVPRGFNPLKPDAFLMKDYTQRTSYCDLLRLQLDNVDESDKRLASLKLRIRHNLNTGDWEGAEEDLQQAQKEWPDNNELNSMRAYLDCHRPQLQKNADTKEKEQSNPDQLNAELCALLRNIPGNLRWLYREAMHEGPGVFHRMAQIVANGPWAKNHGYTSEAQKRANMENEYNKQKTNDYIRNGHTNTIEHNVLAGGTAVEGAIRDDCTKPQYIYTSSVGKEAVFQSVSKNAENESFGYWSIWVSDDISIDLQENICKNLNNPIKTRLRQLNSLGYRFTETGPVPKAGTIADHSTNASGAHS